jgi:hypothetical protein
VKSPSSIFTNVFRASLSKRAEPIISWVTASHCSELLTLTASMKHNDSQGFHSYSWFQLAPHVNSDSAPATLPSPHQRTDSSVLSNQGGVGWWS